MEVEQTGLDGGQPFPLGPGHHPLFGPESLDQAQDLHVFPGGPVSRLVAVDPGTGFLAQAPGQRHGGRLGGGAGGRALDHFQQAHHIGGAEEVHADDIRRPVGRVGDAVLVETPGYYPMFGKLRLQRARTIGVPRGPDGLDLTCLEQAIREHRPRLLFVQPMAHNPTGTSMSLQNMHAVLRIAEQHDLTVIEDDPFGDILPRATPHLASLDALNRVIYVGTFSKTLSASLRCGYIAANRALIRSLTDIKMLTVVNGSSVIERMVHEMIVRGRYRRHMARLRDRVGKAGAEAVAALRGIGLENIQPPTGGYYIWCPLPGDVDGLALAHRASAQGIFLAPGHLFTLGDRDAAPALRINIAHARHPRLLRFLQDEVIRARR